MNNNVDEKIAKLKLEQRIQKEKELNEKESNEKLEKDTEENSDEITLEEVIKQMEEGEVNLEERSFKFRRKSFLGNKIEMPVPLAYFEEKVNTTSNVTLVNDLYGVSFAANYVKKGAVKQTFKQFKAGMEKSLKDMELYLEWLEEGEIGEGTSKISYGTYKTPTGKGDLYNLIFYKQHKGTVLIGNYNCFYTDIKTWELFIKASIMLMKIN
ncbi:hypothetical protein [Clostridium gasigenes]|uniref:Uncharacterized protein n=1 Tax=Clostridium gasigenes TaxID=94869 RepID=A0A1H0QH35_9CLOT|nr:hypothetical protein [Clostridium gasigenes]SDP16594.1 hypothetical protein SAMN04488529_102361 [Clostridium gasigenes]